MPKPPRFTLVSILFDPAARLYRLYFQRGAEGAVLELAVVTEYSQATVHNETYDWQRVKKICAGWHVTIDAKSVQTWRPGKPVRESEEDGL